MKRLLLIGAGHAHAQVLVAWISAPTHDCELVIVSPDALAPYSGMVPGWLAGRYRFDQICIDFTALARRAGAKLIIDELVKLDPDRQHVLLRSGRVLDYDVLSLNVGSTLRPPRIGAAYVLPLRPLAALRQAWESLLTEVAASDQNKPITVSAVGGGVSGVESLLAVLTRLRGQQPERHIAGELLCRGNILLPELAPASRRAAQRALAAMDVAVRLGSTESDGPTPSGDLLLWATGAEAHLWQLESGLAVSASGYIRIDDQLRSLSHRNVYAAGDCAEWFTPLPKSGVFAVRMGPVLSHNLNAALTATRPVSYQPQRRALKLLLTGDGSAIASWGPWCAHGRWVWRWKDFIDRAFVRRFCVSDERNAAVRESRL